MSNKETAKSLGIPETIPIPDSMRHRVCNASEASFLSMTDKQHVKYRGICVQGHLYDVQMTLAEAKETLRKDLHITDDEIIVGQPTIEETVELEEY